MQGRGFYWRVEFGTSARCAIVLFMAVRKRGPPTGLWWTQKIPGRSGGGIDIFVYFLLLLMPAQRARPIWTRKIWAAVTSALPRVLSDLELGRSPFFGRLKTGSPHAEVERPRVILRIYAASVGRQLRPLEIGRAPRTLRLQRHPVPKERTSAICCGADWSSRISTLKKARPCAQPLAAARVPSQRRVPAVLPRQGGAVPLGSTPMKL